MKAVCLRSLLLACMTWLVACTEDTTSVSQPITPEKPQWEQPNILWLVVEDLSPYIAAFGDSTVHTPNLDRLAREGVVYQNVYSPSGVCAPSRFAIATGLYPSSGGGHHMRTGPWYTRWKDEDLKGRTFTSRPEALPIYEAIPSVDVSMHSEYLRQAGYFCTNNAKQDYQFRVPFSAWDQNNREAHWRNRADTAQPFFAIFNFGITHESQIWARAQDSLWVDKDLEVTVPPYLPDNTVGQKDVRQMYSNIVQMDHQIGAVLEELEADGELENTVIFWYSDHGGPLPRQKRLLYDSGLKVPMIVRYPHQWQAGTKDDQLISFIDFKPTLLSLAGIPIPEYCQGQAFVGPQQAEERTYIHAAADRFDERYDMIRAVRTKRFKYLKNFRPQQGYYLPVAYREQMPVMQELLRLRDLDSLNDIQAQWFRSSKPPEELFDCLNDPHELNNLAKDPEYQEILKELRQECQTWMDETNDLGQIEERAMMAQWWPQGQQPQTPDPLVTVDESGQISISTTEGSIAYQWVAPGDSLLLDWQLYTQPLETKAGHQLSILAQRIGHQASSIVTEDF